MFCNYCKFAEIWSWAIKILPTRSGWKTSQLDLIITTTLWRNDCSLLISFIISPCLLLHHDSHINSPLKPLNYCLKKAIGFNNISFSIWVFFHNHLRITRLWERGEGISLTLQYHFHPLHRLLDITQVITPENSPLHKVAAEKKTETFGFFWFSYQGILKPKFQRWLIKP